MFSGDERVRSFPSYCELPQVFTFVRVVPGRLACPAQLVVEPHEQVPDGLGAWDDVEWRRQRAALVKVAHPQLGAGKLPLDVSVVLQDKRNGDLWETLFFKRRPLKDSGQ